MGHVTLSIAPFSVTAVSAPTREHADGCWPAVQHPLPLSFPHAYDTQQMEKEKYKTKNNQNKNEKQGHKTTFLQQYGGQQFTQESNFSHAYT